MLKRADSLDLKNIISYLKQDIADCVYLYIDITVYGLDNPNMKVWYDTDNDGNIDLVVMKYYDSFQLYTNKETYDVESVKELMDKYDVTMVSANCRMIRQLHPLCEEKYKADYGTVLKFGNVKKMISVKPHTVIRNARIDEMYDAAKLICTDPDIGGHYTPESLCKQLEDRMKTKMGRSCIIEENGEILAHVATYAEADGLAVCGGLIAKPEYSSKLYGFAVLNFLMEQLEKENREVFFFMMDPKLTKLYLKMGFNQCADYAKLTKIEL